MKLSYLFMPAVVITVTAAAAGVTARYTSRNEVSNVRLRILMAEGELERTRRDMEKATKRLNALMFRLEAVFAEDLSRYDPNEMGVPGNPRPASPSPASYERAGP